MPVDPTYREIGRRLKAAREAVGVSVERVAELLDVEPVTYRRYEKGQRKIAIPELQLLARFLRVPIADLIDEGTGPRPRRAPAEIARELMVALEDMPVDPETAEVVRQLGELGLDALAVLREVGRIPPERQSEAMERLRQALAPLVDDDRRAS